MILYSFFPSCFFNVVNLFVCFYENRLVVFKLCCYFVEIFSDLFIVTIQQMLNARLPISTSYRIEHNDLSLKFI